MRARPRTVAVAALLAGVLGCRAAEPRPELVLWAMGREGDVVRETLPAFAARHPDVQVRVQQIPWNAAHEKLLTAFVGGAMPDVFQAGNTWLPELVALDAIEPLDARLDASTAIARDDFFPGVLDTNVLDGVTWGVPWYVDTRLLFYRSDLLAAAGHATPPRSWDAWRDAMTAVRGDAADRVAILLPLREWQLPVILALQRGGALLRDDDGRGNFASAPVRDAFAFYLDLFARGLAPRAGDTQVTNVYQDFATGFFAFYVSGPWNLGEFARRLPGDLQDRWATSPLPGPGDEWPGVSLAGGASLVVHRGSTRKDDAWRLVEWLAEPAQQRRLYELAGDLPARRSAWQLGDIAQDPRTAAFWTQLEAVRATPKIPEWERIAARVAYWTEAAVRGGVDLDGALAALDRDVDGILAKRRWLRARGDS